MPLGISQDGPLNVKRTLGSFVPHPANIGKVAGAHLGITAPRMHLANGGRGGSPQNTDITSNMFQPLNASGSNVPNADVNFISSPALAVGPGPGKSQAPTPTQQPEKYSRSATGLKKQRQE